ncbi:UNVERIFIED_CONTAM: hypothetical protein Sangu_2717200, partial [Sesamum angustifolium]
MTARLRGQTLRLLFYESPHSRNFFAEPEKDLHLWHDPISLSTDMPIASASTVLFIPTFLILPQ